MSDVSSEAQSAKNFNAEAFAMNIARAMETSGQALAAYLKPQIGEVKDKPPSEIAEVIKTFGTVAEYWLTDQDRAAEVQKKISKASASTPGSFHAPTAAPPLSTAQLPAAPPITTLSGLRGLSHSVYTPM